MRGLNMLALLAVLVIVAFVAKRQWTATRLPAVAPATAPAAEGEKRSRRPTDAAAARAMQEAVDKLMQQRQQQLHELERGTSAPQ